MSHIPPTKALRIQSASALPAPVGGVITMPEDLILLVEDAPLVLPDQTQLLIPDTSILRGWDTDLNGIVGNVDDAMIIGQGNGLVLNRLFCVNQSVDPNSAVALATTNLANPRVSRFDNLSISGTNGVILDNTAFVAVDVLLDRCTGPGIEFRNANTNFQLSQYTGLGSNSGKVGISVSDTATLTNARFSQSSFLLSDPGSFGIVKAVAATLSNVGFSDVLFTGPGTSLLGLGADTQPDVIFFSSFGVENSRFGGEVAIPLNGAQVTNMPPPPSFVPVGAGNPNHPLFSLSAGSARIQVVGGPNTEDQELEYIGTSPLSVTVQASVSLYNPSGNQQGFAIRVVKNPNTTPVVLDPPQLTGSNASGTTIAASGSITYVASTTLEPGDRLQLQVSNQTTLPDPTFVITSATLGFIGNA